MGGDDWWDHMNGVMNGGGHMSNGWLWWPLWLLLVALVVGVVVLAVVLAGRRGVDGQSRAAGALRVGPTQPPEDAAEALLRERYARGEIDENEYDARLARLRSSR